MTTNESVSVRALVRALEVAASWMIPLVDKGLSQRDVDAVNKAKATIITLQAELSELRQTSEELAIALNSTQDALQEARNLLVASDCPQCGDKSGAYPDGDGEPLQCQWCYEFNTLFPSPPNEVEVHDAMKMKCACKEPTPGRAPICDHYERVQCESFPKWDFCMRCSHDRECHQGKGL